MRRANHVRKDKVVKIRRKPEMINIDVGDEHFWTTQKNKEKRKQAQVWSKVNS